ncbi:hypothetical protein ASPWEDRAFT_686092 [Aspergillus wentii DTO 134E9]|uniref:Uncharacterized protein n=1 Tax=Aspergillus wentii DTO 134E9 TaxID=1073089 RepID=A0A1L9R8F0_ASPWE|nr:uncharacterized protein ASPWEDRAFT_686092 [Aspergillus wentii DTO 134E9]OJJ31200.1 hypothetical protein ASPWEDRAFT_686092 [Aspergillus wentii DTO 134E9]
MSTKPNARPAAMAISRLSRTYHTYPFRVSTFYLMSCPPFFLSSQHYLYHLLLSCHYTHSCLLSTIFPTFFFFTVYISLHSCMCQCEYPFLTTEE